MEELVDAARKWLLGKVELASRLAAGEGGGGYGDAVLILSAVISGIGSELWPGEGIDRKRFVEVWARYADPALHPNRISLPLLVDMLRRDGSRESAERARLLRADCISELPVDSLVVTGDRVDVSEGDVLIAAPELTLVKVRSQSYGSVFYRHFRSSYVHEYKTGTHGDEVVMSRTRSHITYSNWIRPPYRRINFSTDWLTSVAGSICANAAEAYWAGKRLKPTRWWIEG